MNKKNCFVIKKMGTLGHVWSIGIVILVMFLGSFDSINAQATKPAEAPAPICNGVFVSYTAEAPVKIYPYEKNLADQPYSFKATLTITNMGADELKAWQVFVGYMHKERIVSADGAILADGSIFPADVGNGTIFSGYPQTDLKTAIDTAGDMKQISMTIPITGTEFGVNTKSIPMPKNISLANDGFICPPPSSKLGTMEICCTKDPKFEAVVNVTKFLPPQKGDLILTYDVTQSNKNDYWAKVTISNENDLGRLDYWKLSWDWQRGEFIYEMLGAETLEQALSECVGGPPATYYQGLDLTTVMSCEKRPTIVDLTPYQANDTKIGKIPFCCRNGTILPSVMDPLKSKSSFILHVYKLPPDLNQTVLYPPANWKIEGVLNPDYRCGQPRRIDPTEYPDPKGTARTTSAVATWQVVCNITNTAAKPRCCVSFSTFYNESAVPCKTCACGCPASIKPTCNPNRDGMLLPTSALLIPFENRTAKAVAWAGLKHFEVPRPLPCGDYCGVSMNWHINSDYANGWSARITLFNWDENTFPDWFLALQMPKALPGYQNVYSFNGTLMGKSNDTLFMQGLEGGNYLMAEVDGANPKSDPRVPGKQQSIVSFNKKLTPGIDILDGDGFPKKVFFNGEECSLPDTFPIADAYAVSASLLVLCLVSLLHIFFEPLY